MSHILVVGNTGSGLTERLADLLAQQGHTYSILDDQRTTPPEVQALAHHVSCDFSSQGTILAAVDGVNERIDATMTLYENYVLPMAWINKHLSLTGMSEASARACTDKYLMRQAFASSPEPISPAFAHVSSEADVRHFADTHGFPLILKPANLVKSLLVSKSENLEELIQNYRHTASIIDEVYATYAPDRTPSIVIEEFLVGTMHSVAGFAGEDGTPYIVEQVVDLERAQDRGFDDNFLYSRTLPSVLSEEDQAAVRHCAALGIRALGMQGSPAHVEIILTAKGPRIVEIGARNGGYRERMYRMACGIDVVGAALAITLGREPDLQAKKNEACAVIELFPDKAGTFAGIANAEAIQTLPSCVYFRVRAAVGTPVGKAAGGHKFSAVCILHHADVQQVAADLTFLRDNAHVVLQ